VGAAPADVGAEPVAPSHSRHLAAETDRPLPKSYIELKRDRWVPATAISTRLRSGRPVAAHHMASRVRSIHAAVLSALDLAGSARWKHRGVIRILEGRALTVDFYLIGPTNLRGGDGCADQCGYRKPNAHRSQKCADGSRCWATITAFCPA
jgi:hypothetical protein